MRRDLRAFLWDVVQAVDDTFEFIGDRNFNDYEQNKFLRAAVEREVTIIGEALRQAGEQYPEEVLGLETIRGFIGFQAFVTQQYANLNPRYVWESVLLLPELRGKVTERIARIDADQ